MPCSAFGTQKLPDSLNPTYEEKSPVPGRVLGPQAQATTRGRGQYSHAEGHPPQTKVLASQQDPHSAPKTASLEGARKNLVRVCDARRYHTHGKESNRCLLSKYVEMYFFIC